MIKFSILAVAVSILNLSFLLISPEDKPLIELEQEIEIMFNKVPIGIESGEPVYPLNTEIVVKTSRKKEITVNINGIDQIKETASEVNISKLVELKEDTYTVVVTTVDEDQTVQKIFGFILKK